MPSGNAHVQTSGVGVQRYEDSQELVSSLVFNGARKLELSVPAFRRPRHHPRSPCYPLVSQSAPRAILIHARLGISLTGYYLSSPIGLL
eukprot:6205074-Pleurochrysis_carterae.AAC.4